MAAVAPEVLGDLVAVHARQADIQEHEGGLMVAGGFDGRGTVVGRPHVVAEELPEVGTTWAFAPDVGDQPSP